MLSHAPWHRDALRTGTVRGPVVPPKDALKSGWHGGRLDGLPTLQAESSV